MYKRFLHGVGWFAYVSRGPGVWKIWQNIDIFHIFQIIQFLKIISQITPDGVYIYIIT